MTTITTRAITGRAVAVRRLTLLGAVILLIAPFGSTAQTGELDITGAFRFSNPRTTTTYTLTYGVGSNYTDTTDKEYETFVPPFPPPDGFLMVFDRECAPSDGDPPCFFLEDLRGVPDSVANPEGTDRFSIVHRIRVLTPTGSGFSLRINNGDWPLGVDSIRLTEEHIAPSIDTLLTGPLVLSTSQSDIRALRVVVYYNLRTLSVEPDLLLASDRFDPFDRIENPVLSGSIDLGAVIGPGDDVMLIDMTGRVVRRTSGERATPIAVDDLPVGPYHLVRYNRQTGERSERTVIVQ